MRLPLSACRLTLEERKARAQKARAPDASLAHAGALMQDCFVGVVAYEDDDEDDEEDVDVLLVG